MHKTVPKCLPQPSLPGPSAWMPRLRGQGHPVTTSKKHGLLGQGISLCCSYFLGFSNKTAKNEETARILPFTKLCQDVLVRITQKWPANCGNMIPKTWFAKESNLPYLHVWVQNVHVRCCFTIHDTNWRSADNWIPMVNSLRKKNVIWVRISFPTPSSMFKKTDAKNTYSPLWFPIIECPTC